MIKKNSKKAVIVSILLGIAFGIAWGTINFFLMSGNAKPVFHLTIDCFLVSLSPAVLEEMAMRTLFYALCIAFLNGIVSTYFQKLTIWFMMIMPHVLVHTPETFRQDGFVAGLIVVVVYVILFGLIFAILQRKRDITSAMIAHGVVDFIRFCFFGLPF
jgi:membrane protease YdiL (CAAX protease family)